MKKISPLVGATIVAALMLAQPSVSWASIQAADSKQALVSSTEPLAGEQPLSCEMISAELGALQEAATARAIKAQRAAKTKRGLFGFAKTMASVMVPGVAIAAGGGSALGSLAAQGARQSAAEALARSNAPAGVPTAPQYSVAEQERLGRLATLAAERQCGA
ncbi:hypothetical protein [Sphingomonas sp. BK235]|uniref:hypothetical protein n=1 Tax=Sphingomonas sp. BK235 TaxID=2512131 RepID=UPI001046421A|nr:hypothetical protein [Sphingomonas sp. BK235]TCP30063.1 hypothetical protein EV292_1147 [Sphingomonas sp. BK235]